MTAEFIVAVHAIVYLNHTGEYVSSEVLAKNICTNPARVRKIAAELKKAGLVETRAGLEGGYRFVGNAGKISLYDIYRATKSSIIQVSWRSGDPDCEDCMISRSMGPVMDEVFDRIDEKAEAELKKITIKEVDRRIFGKR